MTGSGRLKVEVLSWTEGIEGHRELCRGSFTGGL